MKITFINPNSTVSMTDKVQQAAQAVAPANVIVEAITSSTGPASIQGPEDGEAAIPGLLKELSAATAAGNGSVSDAFIIACFDDTGIEQARQLTDKPVIGIGQAAYHASMLMGCSFSVVTTLSVSIPVIEENIVKFGVTSFCKAVRASEVPVLDLEKPGSNAEQIISDEIGLALADDGCEAIVLGCAGMADLSERLAKRHGVPVIDGVSAATGLACALASMAN